MAPGGRSVAGGQLLPTSCCRRREGRCGAANACPIQAGLLRWSRCCRGAAKSQLKWHSHLCCCLPEHRHPGSTGNIRTATRATLFGSPQRFAGALPPAPHVMPSVRGKGWCLRAHRLPHPLSPTLRACPVTPSLPAYRCCGHATGGWPTMEVGLIMESDGTAGVMPMEVVEVMRPSVMRRSARKDRNKRSQREEEGFGRGRNRGRV